MPRSVCRYLWLLLAALPLLAAERFPPPDFTESGHVLPGTTTPPPRVAWLEYLDVALLVAALGLAAWLLLQRRSRRGLLLLSLACLGWFGFYRQGCICPIGGVQNLALALAEPSYVVPLTVLAFVLLPLFWALLAGRAFCAGVCPHGALQDLVLIRPIQLPLWLERGLRLGPWCFLALGVWLAVQQCQFLICHLDPFVGVFRFSGSRGLIAFGVGMLLLATVIGRPYCRFMCPYGALLSLASRVAVWRVTITPAECTRCRLCETACPYGAILPAEPLASEESRAVARRRLGWLLLLLPLWIAVGAALGYQAGGPLARLQPTVAQAEQVWQAGLPDAPPPTNPVLAFRQQAGDLPALLETATERLERMRAGGAWAGGFLGLVIGLALVSWSVRRYRPDYEADRAHCLGCARCFQSCPIELTRRGLPTPGPLPEAPAP
jgi:ferredoxin